MKKLLELSKLTKNENGQVLVLAALFMTVLMGFAAFAVDIGMVTATKSKLQNAADAAALAGAMDLSYGETKAEETVGDIAGENGISLAEVNVDFPDGVTTLEDELRAMLEAMNDDEIIAYAIGHSIDVTDITLMFKSGVDKNYIIGEIGNKINVKLNNFNNDKQVIDYANENNVGSFITGYLDEKNKNKFADGEKAAAITTIVTKIKENLQGKSDQDIFNIANEESVSLEGRVTTNKTEAINKILEESISDSTPVLGGKEKVKVSIERTVPYTFARVLGFQQATVKVNAVAQKIGFDGSALPFINFSPYEVDGEIELWDREGKGNKERLDTNTIFYEFDPEVGAIHGNGKMANIKKELEPVCYDGATVYVISLKNSVMVDGNEIPITTKNGTEESFVYPSDNVHQGSIIDSDYLVLLKCTVKVYDSKIVTLQVEEEYDDLTPSGISKIDSRVILVE